MKTILVAVDGSENSKEAFLFALSLLDQDDIIMALHVCEGFPGGDWPEGVLAAEALQAAEDRASVTHEALLNQYRRMIPLDSKFIAMVSTGDPRIEICETANHENVDIVVVGSRGLGKIAKLILGSVSDSVVHNCSRPVLVIPSLHRKKEKKSFSEEKKASMFSTCFSFHGENSLVP